MLVQEKIKELMSSDAKFTPEGLALHLSKKTKQYYYDLLDRKDIGVIELESIARYFNVEIGYFFEKKKKGFIEQRLADLENEMEFLRNKFHIGKSEGMELGKKFSSEKQKT